MKVASVVLNNFTHDTRVLKEAITLKKVGFDIEVIALHEEGLKEIDQIDGIPVKRVLKGNWFGKNIIYKLFIYLWIAISAAFQIRKYDIIHCHDLNTLPMGFLVKLMKFRTKIVYDAHEHETEVIGLYGFRRFLAQFLERSLIKFADKVITVSAKISEEYKKLYGVDSTVIFNCPTSQKTKKTDLFRKKFKLSKNSTIFLYQGYLISGRGVETILETFRNIKDKNNIAVFMGYGPLSELVKENAKNHKNIIFMDAVPPSEVLAYTASSDVGLSIIENVCLSNYYCAPNKFFEYAAAGLPIIISDLYELNKITKRYNSGVQLDKIHPDNLIKAIENLTKEQIKEMSKGSLRIANDYCWENQEKKLLELYSKL